MPGRIGMLDGVGDISTTASLRSPRSAVPAPISLSHWSIASRTRVTLPSSAGRLRSSGGTATASCCAASTNESRAQVVRICSASASWQTWSVRVAAPWPPPAVPAGRPPVRPATASGSGRAARSARRCIAASSPAAARPRPGRAGSRCRAGRSRRRTGTGWRPGRSPQSAAEGARSWHSAAFRPQDRGPPGPASPGGAKATWPRTRRPGAEPFPDRPRWSGLVEHGPQPAHCRRRRDPLPGIPTIRATVPSARGMASNQSPPAWPSAASRQRAASLARGSTGRSDGSSACRSSPLAAVPSRSCWPARPLAGPGGRRGRATWRRSCARARTAARSGPRREQRLLHSAVDRQHLVKPGQLEDARARRTAYGQAQLAAVRRHQPVSAREGVHSGRVAEVVAARSAVSTSGRWAATAASNLGRRRS